MTTPKKSSDKWFFWFLLVAFMVVFFYAINYTPSGIKVPGVHQMEPRPLPVVEFKDEVGNIVSTADLPRQVTILHFWATWCAPCIDELRDLNQFQKSLNGMGVKIVPISVDAAPTSHVQEFYDRQGIDALDLYVDPQNDAFRALTDVPALPATVIVNPKGEMVASIRGAFNWKRDEMKTLLQYYASGQLPENE